MSDLSYRQNRLASLLVVLALVLMPAALWSGRRGPAAIPVPDAAPPARITTAA